MIAVCISIFAGFEITDTPIRYCADPSYCDVYVTRDEVGIAWMFLFGGIVALLLPVTKSEYFFLTGIVLTTMGGAILGFSFVLYNFPAFAGFIGMSFIKIPFSVSGLIMFAIGLFTLGVKGLSYLLGIFESLRTRMGKIN